MFASFAGTLNQNKTMALLTVAETAIAKTTTTIFVKQKPTTPSIHPEQLQLQQTDDVLTTTPMTQVRLPLSEHLRMTTTSKDVPESDNIVDSVGPTAFSTVVTTKPTIRTLLGVKTNISTAATATRKPQGGAAAATAKSKSYVPKLKIHKTDAPMLNYIFDSYSTAHKHTHHDSR